MSEIRNLYWTRVMDDPFLSPRKGTAAPEAVTTPDVLISGDRLHLYVGAVNNGTERIIHFPLPAKTLVVGEPLTVPSTAVEVLSPGPGAFDSKHVFDPAVQAWDGAINLYYSAVGEGQDTVGLATSANGRSFSKKESPILVGRSPEVAARDGAAFLFYVIRKQGQGYRIYGARSDDGISFKPFGVAPVLDVGPSHSWDCFEVTTPRIFERKGWFYMLYAGCRDQNRMDMPNGFGIARSKNLFRWQKYPHNPVFTLGDPGEWDDGAIWFGTVFAWDEDLYLIYEGGTMGQIQDRSPALTQVGLAKVSNANFDSVMSPWE
jgi:predicted GH43/DUF377 family glycosyl hydrolase